MLLPRTYPSAHGRASHLRHPNLVLFLGACTVGNEPLVIVSEFMAGGSLEDRFQAMTKDPRGHPVAWAPSVTLAVRWIMDLSRAVCFLHNCTTPIIHRWAAAPGVCPPGPLPRA